MKRAEMPRRAVTEIDYRARLGLIDRHIEEHLGEAVTPADLAKMAGFSVYHLHRIFRGMTGESLEQRVRRLRLERAAKRLRDSGRGVLEIAVEAGYGSHEGFTRAFRDHFGTSPSVFRGEPPPRRDVTPVAPARVELRDIAPVEVAGLRHTGPFAGLPAAFERVIAWSAQRGVALPPARLLGLYYDDPEITPAERLRADVCVETSLTPGAASGVVRRTIPGGRYAVALHVGPPHTITSTYLGLIGGWAPSTRHALADEPVVEVYLDPPGALTPPDELRTEVRVRIEE